MPPGSLRRSDPYHVWLSEVMLQQTTVAAVKPYFEKFLATWPRVQDLADAKSEAVMAAWAGLGYYARARNLHACAKAIVTDHGCRFPNTEAALRTLPGIGAYSAAAIAAIAFGRRAVVVDANVERVVARLAAIDTPLPAAKPAIWNATNGITPDETGRPGDFAQAMMDLGSSICTARAPKCLVCPLQDWCKAKALGIADTLPRKLPKKAKPPKHGWLWWVERDGRLLTERRQAKGMLGGMRALPGGAWSSMEEALELLPPGAVDTGKSVQHGFTHFDLTLHIARLPELGDETGEWIELQTWREGGFPTLYKKAILLMKDDDGGF